MDRKVGIVGYCQTSHVADIDKTRDMMVFETTKGALDNAGIQRDDVGTVINASNDMLDGRTISNVHVTMPQGGYLKDESKTEEDGTFAAYYAMMRVLAGTHDVGLVVAHTQGSTFNPHQVFSYMADPTFERQYDILNDISMAALQARMYMSNNGISEEQVASVAAKNLRNAADNEKAQRKMPDVTLDEILRSKLYYDPIRELTKSPISDGCAALVLASEDKAKEICDDPVWIEGVGSYQSPYLRDRDMSRMKAVKEAAKRAYDRADIEDPFAEIDVAEISERFAHEELMLYEALDFCREGKGGALMDNCATYPGAELPVNPSGGALSADPITATGLIRMIEAVKQIKGEAGKHQVPVADKALVHGQTGLCAQSNMAYVLGGG